jgi:hypothetical protein
MAHKAKSGQKTKLTQKTKTTQKWNKDTASYSFTEPVIRVLSDTARKESGQHEKTRSSQHADTKPHFVVFHKRENARNKTDIIGTRGLNSWKKSSGRSKSWANCRRLKLAQDGLEFLAPSKSRPISLGWRFSMMITPSLFVRSQGMRVYQQSETKKKGLSRIQAFKDLDAEYAPKWPLPTDLPSRWLGRHQEIEYRGGMSFIRLKINRGVVNMTQEAFLEKINFSTPQSEPFNNEKCPRTAVLEDLVVIHLLRNESHADVYLVQSPSRISRFYHAHAFLSDVSGNVLTFSRRRMERLRRSNGFYAETVQLGRKIIVMEAYSKVDKDFHIKNMQREFPLLPGTGENPLSTNLALLDIYSADNH